MSIRVFRRLRASARRFTLAMAAGCFSIFFLLALFAPSVQTVSAKAKDKPVLPSTVLQAHTVAVLVDPTAGVDINDPQANQVAQKDVETAFANWSRYENVIGAEQADLIVVIRRGHKYLVDRTIPDARQNNRAGVINPTQNGGVSVGAQHGTQPPIASGPQATTADPTRGQTEIGNVDDSFLVFDGTQDKPLDAPPLFRYTAKDALKPHSVPAVDEFRKAVAAAEKAAAAKKP